jgi:hypothetical protein
MDESSIAAGNWDIDLDTTSNQNSRRKVVEDVISAK